MFAGCKSSLEQLIRYRPRSCSERSLRAVIKRESLDLCRLFHTVVSKNRVRLFSFGIPPLSGTVPEFWIPHERGVGIPAEMDGMDQVVGRFEARLDKERFEPFRVHVVCGLRV